MPIFMQMSMIIFSQMNQIYEIIFKPNLQTFAILIFDFLLSKNQNDFRFMNLLGDLTLRIFEIAHSTKYLKQVFRWGLL